MSPEKAQHRQRLLAIARRALHERGLEPDFSRHALAEAEALAPPEVDADPDVRDLRTLPWCSIDNDDSRDLDQLSWAERLEGGDIRVYVAIADVDALVPKGSVLDRRAAVNTTSVYTPVQVFPMLPERLSTDLTSLNEGEDRLALVTEMVVAEDGRVGRCEIYRAAVRNHAKLAYPGVGAWLEAHGELPARAAAVPGLDRHLRLQDEAACRLRRRRSERGALELELREPRPVLDGDRVTSLREEARDRAKALIEDFMVAANQATAALLEERGYPWIRRLVRKPKRWPRIVQIAREMGEELPREADPKPLQAFLERRRAADPEGFPELSLTVVKLLGSGEYMADLPGRREPGHFGLAARDYAHSTAPNRRYPDLVLQRLLKAALLGDRSPYEDDELIELARHCTEQEDDAARVERLVRKAAAALLLEDRVGDRFRAVVTGASEKGTWVRIFDPPVEGKLVEGSRGLNVLDVLDVGDRVRVRLVGVDPDRGFIDFARS